MAGNSGRGLQATRGLTLVLSLNRKNYRLFISRISFTAKRLPFVLSVALAAPNHLAMGALGPAMRHNMQTWRPQPAGDSLLRIFDIDSRQQTIQFQQNFTEFTARDFVTWLQKNLVTRSQVIRRRPKLFNGEIELASYLPDCEQKMVDVDFLASDIRHFTLFAYKGQ